MRLLNISDKLINLKNKLKLKNAVSIAAAVMLGVTLPSFLYPITYIP